MKSFCLLCDLRPETNEIAIASWYGLGMIGCEEKECGQYIQVKCYFSDLASAKSAQADLLRLGAFSPAMIKEVPDLDWNAQWKASMRPALVAPGIWVSPKWMPPQCAPGELWIKIEPKMAFGTGHHATTRLAASAARKIAPERATGFSLLDIGTGTGVLCFIAELSGAGKTIGIDIDPVCAENIAENRRDNPSSCSCAFAIGSLDMLRNAPNFDCIVMNMISSESEPLLKNIFNLLKVNGRLIWSGLLIEEKNTVIEHASEKGFYLRGESSEEEWWCGVFQKRSV